MARAMKIYYVANIRVPTEKAHGIQIMKMCEAFANLGHEVELVVPKRNTSINEDAFSYYGVKNNFRIKRLHCLDTVHWGRLGFRIETISFNIRTAWYLLFKRGLFYTREEITAVMLWSMWKQVVWEAHMGHSNIFVRILILIHAPLITISESLKKFYCELGARGENIGVAHDSVDLEQFDIQITKVEARKRLGIAPEARVAMYVGLFDEWKGYRTLLEASKIMEKEDIRLVMIGGENKQVEKLRREYPKVLFVGFRPYSELPMNQRGADVLVIPNSRKMKISQFTSPIKLFAHMASGVPIVISDLSSMREVLDESTAYFCEPDDPEILAQTIKQALSNPLEAANKAHKSRIVVEQYTWGKRAENILKFISNA